MATFSFLLPMASSLRRYSVPEQEQWLFNESVLLFFLIPCYQSNLPKNNTAPPPSQNLLSVLTDDWNVLSLGSDSKSKIPSPTSYCLTLSVYVPCSSHTAQLFPRHTALFFLPKYCSHCSLSLKCSSAAQHPTLPLTASLTPPPLQNPSWLTSHSRKNSLPFKLHSTVVTPPLMHWSYSGFDSFNQKTYIECLPCAVCWYYNNEKQNMFTIHMFITYQEKQTCKQLTSQGDKMLCVRFLNLGTLDISSQIILCCMCVRGGGGGLSCAL